MHNNIPAEPDPANGSDPQIDPYERFNELAMRLQKHGASPWNLLDDQLMDNLIGTDQPEVDPDFADLANSFVTFPAGVNHGTGGFQSANRS